MHRQKLAVLAVVGALVLWGGAATAVQAPTDHAASDAVDGGAAASAVQEANASVTFENQTVTDGTVTVESVTLPEGGYVTIHDSSLFDGDATGSVVGVSEYLEPGTHENVSVTLYDDVVGADFSNATTPTGTETFVAMPHRETGDNETYAFVATNGTEDGPYVTDGEAVVDAASVTFAAADEADRGVLVESLDAPPYAATNTTVTVNATLRNTADDERTEDVAFRLEGGNLDVVVHENVTVPAGETANVSFDVNTTGVAPDEYIHGVTTYNSSEFTTITVTDDAQVDFDDQDSDGTSVTVDDLFVPEGGYVTIHDSSLFDGDATGSVVGVSEYLEAGYYEDVEVTLFEGVPGADFEDEELGDNETLVAMPHLETTNDTSYDFVASSGSDDGPYVTDGEAVVEAANVTLTTGDEGDADADGEDEGEGEGEAGDGEGEGEGEAGDGEGEGEDAGEGEGDAGADDTTTTDDEAGADDEAGGDDTTTTDGDAGADETTTTEAGDG